MSESLFSRLVACSQNPHKQSVENFTTEVVAHLVNNDQTFRKLFIRHVIPDGRTARRFLKAEATTQVYYPRGIVDLVLANRAERKILVENKIGSGETKTKIYGHGWKSQISKYLGYREDGVVYLTTRDVPYPAIRKSKRFLGHCFFEDLYRKLANVKNLTYAGVLFRKFMEEQNMIPLRPFTRLELKKAQDAFSFAKKCEEQLNKISSVVGPFFKDLFRTKAAFTSGHFSPTFNGAYIYTKRFNNDVAKRIWLGFDPSDGLRFYLAVETRNRRIDNLNRYLRWEKDGKYLNSWLELKGRDSDSPKIGKHCKRELKKLRLALERAN